MFSYTSQTDISLSWTFLQTKSEISLTSQQITIPTLNTRILNKRLLDAIAAIYHGNLYVIFGLTSLNVVLSDCLQICFDSF